MVVQDTGFSSVLPSGTGMIAFNTAEEALSAIETVEADYAQHAQGAVQFAADYFDPCHVLGQLIENVV